MITVGDFYMKEEVKIRYPSYIKEFKCIGGNCSDNCCHGWEIHIDKNTFDKYVKIQNNIFVTDILENIIVRKNCKNPKIDYGQIKLNTETKCPFLRKDNYCSIHTNLGEDYLSKVCTTYPRIINKIDDCYELSLNVSCIEAARIILLNEEGITFDYSRELISNNYVIAKEINTNTYEINDTNYKYIKEIRDKSINIITNRKYELSERLFDLGLFLENVRRKLCYNYDNTVQFVDEYDIRSNKAKFQRDINDYMLQISFYKGILEKLASSKFFISDNFREIIDKVMLGFKFTEDKSLIENSQIYLKAYTILDKEVFEPYSYIFENYLVNHMFKELFPFSENDIVYDGYIMMLVRLSYIKFFIAGYYLSDGKITIDNIIKIIQSLTKEIEHDETYLKYILTHIKEYELDNKRFAKILL
jgi:lysine-N-methylase